MISFHKKNYVFFIKIIKFRKYNIRKSNFSNLPFLAFFLTNIKININSETYIP